MPKGMYRFDVKDPTYWADGLISTHNADFVADPSFSKAYNAGKQTGSWERGDIRWRVFVTCWAAEYAAKLPGDFVECGVNRGGMALAVVQFVSFSQIREKKFYLVDTYSGGLESQLTENERKKGVRSDRYSDCFKSVCETFEKFDNVKIVRGVVPEILPSVAANTVAFLSLDMNCVLPELAAIEYFWSKISPGGVVVLDDYGFQVHINQKIAFDEFATRKSTRVLALPTGQGIIIKSPSEI